MERTDGQGAAVPDLTPPRTAELAALGFDLQGMIKDNRLAGWNADLPALRTIFPALRTYDQWLATAARTPSTNSSKHDLTHFPHALPGLQPRQSVGFSR